MTDPDCETERRGFPLVCYYVETSKVEGGRGEHRLERMVDLGIRGIRGKGGFTRSILVVPPILQGGRTQMFDITGARGLTPWDSRLQYTPMSLGWVKNWVSTRVAHPTPQMLVSGLPVST